MLYVYELVFCVTSKDTPGTYNRIKTKGFKTFFMAFLFVSFCSKEKNVVDA